MEYRPYKSTQVANFFLEKAAAERVPITMLKLVKLSYIAHGWNLGLTGNPLLDEAVEAWKYGPVVPSVYHEFKRFQRNPITEKALDFNFETLTGSPAELPKSDKDTRVILEKVWDVYKTVTGNQLIDRTHAENTPWEKHYNSKHRHIVIPDEDIRVHYVDVLTKMVAV